MKLFVGQAASSLDETGVVEDHPTGYCEDKDCWCHFSVSYHEQVTEMPVEVSMEEYQQALSFFGVGNTK